MSCEIQKMAATEYHSMHGVSASMLKALAQSPTQYKREYVDGIRDDPTREMIFGTAFHCLVLEEQDFNHRYHVEPKVDRRTTAGKAAWAGAMIASQGRILLNDAELNKLLDMRHKLRSMAWWQDYAGRPDAEVETVYTWHENGIDYRAMIDIYVPSLGLIIDIKTCQDASPIKFSSEILSRYYDIQAAQYIRAIKAAGRRFTSFAFAACAKSDFNEVCLQHLNEDQEDSFNVTRERTIEELISRTNTGDWLHNWERTPVVLPKLTRSDYWRI
jgi:hypothetical protein